VQLELFYSPPQSLHSYLTDVTAEATNFWCYIYHYNSALCFTSVNYYTDTRVTGGYLLFQIQGELFHLHGPLEAAEGMALVFMQVWFLDPEYTNTVCLDWDINLKGRILLELMHELQLHNP
jgi:hypothetical protein